MRGFMRMCLITVLLCGAGAGRAGTTEAEAEIQHLLGYVQMTPCLYERNGELHDGGAAVEHIRKKYDYYRDRIRTAEDFIEYSATKSALSGRHYRIHCEGLPSLDSRQWLLNELRRYRLTARCQDPSDPDRSACTGRD